MTTTTTADPGVRPVPIRGLAAARGVHPETIRRAIHAGKLRSYPTPGGHHRVRPADFDAAFPPA